MATSYASHGEAAKALGVSRTYVSQVVKSLEDKGVTRLIKGRYRVFLENTKDLDLPVIYPKPKGAGVQVEVEDLQNNSKTVYNSILAVVRAIDVRHSTISSYLSRGQKKPWKGRYIFRKITAGS
jgi:predicted transcriptional regulator of viral defense system